MGFFSLRSWLNRPTRSARRASRRRFHNPLLERLEDRLAPATDVWTGRGGIFNWNIVANWSNGKPNPGDDIVFPSNVPSGSLTSTNNLPAGTNFNSITFSGSGYTLSGNAITLGTARPGTGSLIMNVGATNDIINFNISLGGAAGNRQFVTVNTASAVLTLNGQLSAAQKVNLTKNGAGTLILTADNSGLPGPMTVQAGALQITNQFALGPGSSTTTVQTGAQLQINNVAGNIPEPLQVNGPGLANDGAVLNIAGNNTLTGRVDMDSDTTFGATAGSLVINGQIGDFGAGHSLTKEGPGAVVLDPLGTAAGNTYRGHTYINAGILGIRHSLALGPGGSTSDSAVVNSTPAESGTLQLQWIPNSARIDPNVNSTNDGFTVPSELLTINGPGAEGIHVSPRTGAATPVTDVTGALSSSSGNNYWTQPITLWSNVNSIQADPAYWPYPAVAIGAEQGSTLTINGSMGQPVLPVTTVIGERNNLGRGYAGLDFNQSQGLPGTAPPDSNGAGGPYSYVETVNQTIAIYPNKYTATGALTAPLADFFTNVGGLAPADAFSGFSDPIVAYDDNIPGQSPFNGRFIVVDENVDAGVFGESVLDIAVSKTANPTSLTKNDWNFFRLNTTEDIAPGVSPGLWADYPGNLGYNQDALVVTFNMFDTFGFYYHVQLNTIDIHALINGTPLAFGTNVFQQDVTDAKGNPVTFGLRPATMHDAKPGDPMWFVAEQFPIPDGLHMDVFEMTNVLSTTPLPAPTVLQVKAYSQAGLPSQPDGSAVGSLDSRILKAAVANNTLVAAHTISTGSQDAARWYSIDVSSGTPVLKDQGDVILGKSMDAYMPSVDINPAGDIGLTLMGSGTGTGQFPSMYIAERTPTDPAGTMHNIVEVPDGTGVTNYHDFVFRIGDMSGLNVDPLDGSFWAVNEFANTDLTANWGTAIANFFVNPNTYDLVKTRPGRVVFTNVNTFTGVTQVVDGYLAVGDSQALGPNAVQNSVHVLSGGSLELLTDANPDSLNSNPANRFPGQTATDITILQVPLTFEGLGANGVGALHNLAGTNYWNGPVSLRTSIPEGTFVFTANGGSIGVEPDPDPFNTGGLGYNDFSQLTVMGVISGSNIANFHKVDGGELVLTAANTYTGTTFLDQGWITARNNQALGARIPALNDLLQPGTIVAAGAALDLKTDLNGNPLTIDENLTLNGTGFPHRNAWLNNQGALENLDGLNTIVSSISFNGQAGIGVEQDGNLQLPPPPPGPLTELTLTGPLTEVNPRSGFIKLGSQRLIVQGSGDYTGPVDIQQGVLRVQNDNALGLGTGTATVEAGAALELKAPVPAEAGGIARGLELWTQRLVLNGPGNTTAFNYAVPGAPIGALTNVSDDNMLRGPITLASNTNIDVNHGSRLVVYSPIDDALNPAPTGSNLTIGGEPAGDGHLVLAGNNTYGGINFIDQGTVNLQSGSALGAPSVSDTQTVTLSGSNKGTFSLSWGGQTTPFLPFNASSQQVQAALNALTSITNLGGSVIVTLSPTAPVYTVAFTGNLIGYPQPLLTGSATGGTKIAIASLVPGHGGTIVANNAGLVLQGDITVGGKSLQIQGQGSPSEPFTNGLFDRSFGINGQVQFNFTSSTGNTLLATAIQADGKVVAVGSTNDFTATQNFALARFNPDGTLDTNFGNGGRVTTDFGLNLPDQATSVVIQSDGKIVAGGWTTTQSGASEFALARYNPDGTLDKNFGNGGLVVTPFNGGATLSGLALQPDGKILAAGSNGNFILVRYNADGSRDSTFGTGGIAITGGPLGNGGTARAILLQPDGKIVLGGQTANGQSAVARYNPNGTLDTGFGNGGIVITTFGFHQGETIRALALLPDNRIVATGAVNALNATSDISLLCLTPDGRLDVTFGTGGLVHTDLGNSDDAGNAVVVTADGHIVVAGSRAVPGGSDAVVVGYNSDGSLDTTFGNGGMVITNYAPGGNDSYHTLLLQPDGRAVAGGSVNGGQPFILARFLLPVPRILTPTWFTQGPMPITNGQTPGNQPVTGRVSGVTVDPTNPNVLYVAAASGGGWKSTDGGLTWHQLNDNVNPGPIVRAFDYQGLSSTQDANLNFGVNSSPANSVGAAGPSSYVQAVQQSLAIYRTKDSAADPVADPTFDFWYIQGGLPQAVPFVSVLVDPVVIYDDNLPGLAPNTGRFIIGELDVDTNSHVSTFDIAVSRTASPRTLLAGDWNFYQISTSEDGYDAQDPGNFGYNLDAFVFTLNQKANKSGATDHAAVYTLDTRDLVNGVSQANLNFFINDHDGWSFRPTVMHDAKHDDPLWFVETQADTKHVADGLHVNVYQMTSVLSNTATFTQTQLTVNPFTDVTNAPPIQPDLSIVETAKFIDSRILKAAEENNTLVASQTVDLIDPTAPAGTTPTQGAARWYIIDVSSGTPVLKDQGDQTFGDDSYSYYPSIDINPAGDIGMTFMSSGEDAGKWISMYITGRNANDPAGTMEPPMLVPAGTGQDIYTDSAGSSPPRTGDLSGINVDPTDGKFWATTEFANTEAVANWGTAISSFTVGPIHIPTVSIPANTLQPAFTGAVAVAPSDPRVVYLGTGEADNSGDSYYGRGVYKSTDGGQTWTLLTGNFGLNELNRMTISKIVVDPQDANVIYVAVNGSGTGTNTLTGTTQTGGGGIWRYDGSQWLNLTGQRRSGARSGSFLTPGPDDDGNTTFYADSNYTDLVVVQDPNNPTNRIMAFAMGTITGGDFPFSNAVFISVDSGATWFEAGFPTTDPDGSPHSGNIKVAMGYSNAPYDNKNDVFNLFAAVTWPTFGDGVPYTLREIQFNTITWDPIFEVWNIGSWKVTKTTPPNYMGTQGYYDSTIAVDPNNFNKVYVAGVGQPFTPGPLVSPDGGTTWNDIGVGADGNAPHNDYHSMAFDSQGRLLVGTDGGIWRLDNPTVGSIKWTDLNGNLAITQFNGLALDPSNPFVVYAGSQDNGQENYNNAAGWTHTDDGDGGVVLIDNLHPNIIYHVQNGALRKSTDAGQTWKTVFSRGGLYFPVIIDQVNTSRLLVGDGAIPRESVNQGNPGTFINLDPNGYIAAHTGPLVALAYADSQGNFQADPAFPNVTDGGANAYVPGTIYVASDDGVALTRDHGLTWVERDPGTSGIVDITVDPRDSNTAYIVTSVFNHPHVMKTTDGGLHWIDISSNLPNLPTWKVVVDPKTGDVYVGNDNGVWRLPFHSTVWQRFGIGMPTTQVKTLSLDLNTDRLTAGTYGRSLFELWLDDYKPSSGGMRGTGGHSDWNGPISLTGNLVVASDLNAQVTFDGPIINDNTANHWTLTKVDPGNVVLAGADTYGGGSLTTDTFVQQGTLTVDNAFALGAASSGTIVSPGAALDVASDIVAEPITLYGNGLTFNGHFTGALNNLTNFNTDSGPITLGSNSTIGVASGSQLTITGVISDAPNTFSLTKEETGTLVLNAPNTYQGGTIVEEGALNVQHPLALGGTNVGTQVQDGAQLQLQGGVTVVGQPLLLSGTGINGTGALSDNGGNNTWQGPITLTSITVDLPPPTLPTAGVAIGTANAGDTLFVDGQINEQTANSIVDFGVQKVGPGTVVLQKANIYTGLTEVMAGILAIQDPNALGTAGGPPVNGTVVDDGATLALDLDPQQKGTPVTVNGETLTLNGQGVNGMGALDNLSGANTWAGAPMILNTSSAIGVDGGNLTVTGDIQGPATSALSKVGVGTLFLPTANDYQGQTQVLIGLLNVAAPGALGTGNHSEVQAITIPGLSGTFTITFNGQTTPALPYNAPATGPGSVQAALNALASIGGPVGGSVSVTQNGVADVQTIAVTGTAGTYTLTFNGFTTIPIAFNAPATGPNSVQAALNALQSIGGVGGSVNVTQVGTLYTVTFAGTLGVFNQPQMTSVANGCSVVVSTQTAGNGIFTVTFLGTLAGFDQPQMTAAGSGGTTASVRTITDGSGGTLVNGGTLQLAGGLTYSGETLQLAGTGYNGAGALDVPVGAATWDGPVALTANATLAADTDSVHGPATLTVDQTIGDLGGGSTLTKIGTGTVVFSGTTNNTYPGMTFVNVGRLQLNKAGGAIAIAGDLTVGDGTPASPSTDIVQLLASNQIAPTSNVIVNTDGLFDLNGQAQTVTTLNMTGGHVSLTGPTGQLSVTAGVQATSDSGKAAAVISGAGTLILAPAGSATTLPFTVSAGPGPVDLQVSAVISGASGIGLTKTGTGTLSLTGYNTYTGSTVVTQGALLADGLNPTNTIGPVSMNGGVLGGVGTVGPITATSSGGTVAAGDNAPGILTVAGDVTFNAQITFQAQLNGTTLGTGYNQLVVNGNVNLGNATLSGILGNGFIPTVNVDTFTILQVTGTGHSISGTFASGSVVYFAGYKFSVTYTSTTVTIERIPYATTTTVSVTPTSGVPNTSFTITVTITPEPGAAGFPTPGTVTITVVGSSTGYNKTYNPAVVGNGVTVTLQGLAPDTYTITQAQYNSTNPGVAGSSATTQPTFTVAQDTTTTSDPSASPNSPAVYGQTVTFQVTVTPGTAGPVLPGQTVTFFDNTVALPNGTVTIDTSSGKSVASYVTTALPVGSHQISATYNGDSNYTGSSSVNALPYIVKKDASTVTIASTNANAVFGEPVITATVGAAAPGSGVPTGTVTFTVVNTGTSASVTEKDTLSGGVGTLQQILVPGTYQITATYSGDSNFLAQASSNNFTQVVNKANTAVNVASSNTNSVYGEAVITATVGPVAPGAGLPTGTVTFSLLNKSTQVTVTEQDTLSAGKATLQRVPDVGTYQITATYSGDSNFNSQTASNKLAQTVNKASTTVTVASSNTNALYGQAVITATIGVVSPGAGTPTGTVTFSILNKATNQTTTEQDTLSGAKTTLQQLLSPGSYTITATYAGDTDFNSQGSSNSVTQTVNIANAKVNVASSNTNSVYGEAVITATVSPVSPAGGVPTGTATFSILNTATNATTTEQDSLVTGVATLQQVLVPGSYQITASYGGDTNFNSQPGSNTLSQTVSKAKSSVTIASTSTSSVYGQSIAITATVAAVSPGAGTPTGTVTFFVVDTATSIATTEQDTLSGGIATLQQALKPSTYQITATYTGDGNFLKQNTSNTVTQVVSKAGTTVTVASTNANSVYGEAVITATIGVVSPGAGTPTGTVTFSILNKATNQTTTEQDTLSGAKTTLQQVLVPGSYQITATYSGDGNFNNQNSSNTLAQTVSKAGTTVTVGSTNANSVYGEAVITATVGIVSPGAGTLTGSVTFSLLNKANNQTTTEQDTLSAGKATLQRVLDPGTYQVTASYSGDSNFNSQSASNTLAQTVSKASTTVTVASTNTNALYGQAVITATIGVVSPGAGTPTGTVTFSILNKATNQTATEQDTLSGASATLQQLLSPGSYTITATYAGDIDFKSQGSSNSVTQQVSKANAAVNVASTNTNSVYGQAVITVTVSPVSPAGGVPTGTTTFSILNTATNVTATEQDTLVGGAATLQQVLSPGSFQITATYSGDSNFNNQASSNTVSQTVSKASTTVSVASTNTNAVYGEAVITATVGVVSPGVGTPTGNVTFFILNTATKVTTSEQDALAGNKATLQQVLGPGSYQISATYLGDPNFANQVNSNTVNQAVAKASTTVNVASTSTNAPYGQAVITATINPVAPGAGTPTGTATFSILNTATNTTTTEQDTLSGGKATLQQFLNVGSYTITATYSGDANFQSKATSNTVSQTVTVAATTTTVTSSANPSVSGQTVVFTATVSGGSGAPAPPGTVTFFIGGVQQTPDVNLTSGVATLTVSNLAVRSAAYAVSATYNPPTGGNFQTSAGSLSGGQTVNKATPTVGVSSTVNPSVFGQSVTISATFTPPYTGSPGGTANLVITDSQGHTVQQQSGVTISSGAVTFAAISNLSASATPYSVQVVYSGDANFASTSAVLTGGQIVNKAGTQTTVVSSATNNTSNYGDPVTFTATVTVTGPGKGTPGGSVNFFDGTSTTPLNQNPVALTANGNQFQAAFTTAALQLTGGSHSITAVYVGDPNFATSTSPAITQTVNLAATATSDVTASFTGTTPVYGQVITFSATVTAAANLGTFTGTVNFYDNINTLIGSGSVSGTGSATATAQVSTLSVGGHSINAVYQGDTNFAKSSSQHSLSQQVIPDNTTTAVNSTNTNAVYGGASVTATVSPVSPGVLTPTGTVTFTVVNTAVSPSTTTTETDPLVGGVATLSVLSPGTYTIQAVYNPTANLYNTSTSSTLSQTITPDTTSVSVSSSGSPTFFGQAVTFTATITPTVPTGGFVAGTGNPTGKVTFLLGSTALGQPVSLQLVNGHLQAGLAVTSLPAATNQTITAKYAGDINYSGNSGTVQQTVNPATTTTTVVSSSPNNTSPYGQTVTFTATVSVSQGAGTPQGKVDFYDGGVAPGNLIGSATLSTVGTQQQASMTTTPTQLTVGNHSIAAVYTDNVDSNFASSQSATLTQTVSPAQTFSTIQSQHVTPVVGHSNTFTATVATVVPKLLTPTGSVTFSIDGNTTTVSLDNNGQATLTLSNLALGSHTATVTYNPTGSFVGNTSKPLVFTVLTPNQGYVAQVYRDLLGREVDASGLNTWSTLLDNGTLTRSQLASSIESSQEYRGDVIDGIYVHYLHRHADQGGLSTFLGAMAGGMTDEQVAASLISSPEYFNVRGGGTVTGFLTALFQDALNRAIDPTGLQTFTQILNSGAASRQQVAAGILGSLEYEQDLVTNYYNTFLHRNPDPSGLAAWSNALAHGITDETVIASLIGSDEYFNNL
jgi:uncharacterized delta-60 repeat protein